MPKLLAFLLVLALEDVGSSQIRGLETRLTLGGRTLAVSADEMRALSDLGNSLNGGDGAQDRFLTVAKRSITSADGRYALASYEFDIGRKRGDEAMQARALDVLIASDLLPGERLARHLAVRGQLALKAGELAAAEQAWTRVSALQPGEPTHLINLAQVAVAQGRWQSAAERLTSAIRLRERAAGRAPEEWYRQRLGIAQRGRSRTQAAEAGLDLVSHYGSPANWRSALLLHRELAGLSGPAEVDLLRLMQRTGALSQAGEYLRLAQLLRLEGQAKQAKAVLDHGVRSGLLNPLTSPTREIIAEVERSLLARPASAVKPHATWTRSEARVREGVTQLEAGQHAAAIAAFRSAAASAAGDDDALARYWLLWVEASGAADGSAVSDRC